MWVCWGIISSSECLSSSFALLSGTRRSLCPSSPIELSCGKVSGSFSNWFNMCLHVFSFPIIFFRSRNLISKSLFQSKTVYLFSLCDEWEWASSRGGKMGVEIWARERGRRTENGNIFGTLSCGLMVPRWGALPTNCVTRWKLSFNECYYWRRGVNDIIMKTYQCRWCPTAVFSRHTFQRREFDRESSFLSLESSL